MKIGFLKRWPLFLVLAASIFSGCTKEDESDCYGDMVLTFRFTQGGQNNFGPQVPSLSVFVFDEAGIYLGRWDETDNSKFAEDYKMTLPLPPGKYSFVVWGGLDNAHYYLCRPGESHAGATGPVIGETHMDQMLLRVVCATTGQRNEVGFVPNTQFHGEAMDQTVVAGTANDVPIDLVKNSKEIRITILGLPLPGTRANPFTQMSMWLDAANGGYNFRNKIESNGYTFTYLEQGKDGGANNSLVASLHTFQMKLQYSHTFTLWDSEEGSVYHTADLLRDYISKVPAYSTQAGIDAEDLFDIVLDLHPEMGVSVKVNGWQVEKSGHDQIQ